LNCLLPAGVTLGATPFDPAVPVNGALHQPKAEKQFVADGNAASYDKLMHNDFLIVGPASDPAHIKGR